MSLRGVLYCAIENPAYLEAAVVSAFALRQLEPELPITLITDLPLPIPALHRQGIAVKHVEIPNQWRSPGGFASRLVKTSLPEFSDFEQTLYLDADVLPILPIHAIWSYLEAGDLVMKPDVQAQIGQCDHIDEHEKQYTLKHCPADTPHYNAGVMLWRRTPSTTALFQAWKAEWQVFHQHDQLAFVRALQTHPIPVVALPDLYNFPAHLLTATEIERNEVRLLHCLKGFVRVGRFRAIAERLMPESTERALSVLQRVA